MSSKRKFADFDADAPKHHFKKSRDRQYTPGHHPTNWKKKTRDDGSKSGSINWLKKRARNIERRFKADQNLPANVQNDLERELAHHKQKIAELSDDKLRKSMISKYHMVRFFGMPPNPDIVVCMDPQSRILTDSSERKKADRLAKQIRKQLNDVADEEETKRLKADLHTAEIDSIYCRYYPHREPYISLYPVASGDEKEKPEDASMAAKALRSERPPMWRTIEEAASKGERALVEIRERKPAGIGNEKTVEESPSKDSFAGKANQSRKNGVSASASAGSQPSKAKRKAQAPQASSGGALGSRGDDDESDGGFFEED